MAVRDLMPRTRTRDVTVRRGGETDPVSDSAAIQETLEFNKKVLEIAQANVNAAFDCAREMIDAKSPSEFIVLYTRHVSQQFQAITRQTRELTELAQKAVVHSMGPDMIASATLLSGTSDRLRYSAGDSYPLSSRGEEHRDGAGS